MVGGGRNGGRGRGTGRGALMEQLGIQRGEIPPQETQEVPPELYPKLNFQPIPIPEEKNISQSYLLVVKKEIRDYFQNSDYFIQLDAERPDIERYSDRFQHMLNNKKTSLSLCWSRFPKELHPITQGKKRKKKVESVSKVSKKPKDSINVKDKLEELEKKESSTPAEEEEGGEDEEDPVENIDEMEEDVDEEMDEGTDYINSYFDNGEEYSVDDDDVLEEGGVL